MNQKTIRILVAITIGLVLLLLAMQIGERGSQTGRLLLPDFEAVANNVDRVVIYTPVETESVTIQRKDDGWGVTNRNDYAADLGKLGQLITQLARAEILEEKTANPENYDKLGVGDPQSGGKGSKVVVNGEDFSYAVILGNTAQGSYRYARIAEDEQSLLINQNPTLPVDAGDWLAPDILDIGADQVKKLVISHADGETITIEKTEQEQTDFDVTGIPEGRELSHATVGNNVAAALDKLVLEDVRPSAEAPVVTTTVYETWDGVKVTARVAADDQETSWIMFAAEAAGDNTDASNQATEINKRVAKWQYKLADYKDDLLTRRWADLLKQPD